VSKPTTSGAVPDADVASRCAAGAAYARAAKSAAAIEMARAKRSTDGI